MKFSFRYTYFTAVCSKFTGSNHELCSPTNYNTGRVSTETWFKQQLFGPKSVEFLHCWRSHTSTEMPLLIYSKRHTRDVCMPGEIQRSVFSRNIDFLSSLPELGKINVTVFFYLLLFQVYPEISALWMDPTEMTQWEVACTMLTGKVNSGTKLTDKKSSTKMF